MKNKSIIILCLLCLLFITLPLWVHGGSVNPPVQKLAPLTDGWNRIDDRDSSITYTGNKIQDTYSPLYLQTYTRVWGANSSAQFSFTGTQFRVIVMTNINCATDIRADIDGTISEHFNNSYYPTNGAQYCVYESPTLSNGSHSVTLTVITDPLGSTGGFFLDAIDTNTAIPTPTPIPVTTPELCYDYSIVGSLGSYNPGSISSNSQAMQAFTVTGAQLGDLVQVSFDQNLLGITLYGYVSTTNQVTVVFQNNTNNSIILTSGIIQVRVSRHTRG